MIANVQQLRFAAMPHFNGKSAKNQSAPSAILVSAMKVETAGKTLVKIIADALAIPALLKYTGVKL